MVLGVNRTQLHLLTILITSSPQLHLSNQEYYKKKNHEVFFLSLFVPGFSIHRGNVILISM